MAILEAISIRRRVGAGGENLRPDVENVVKLLKAIPASEGGADLPSSTSGTHLSTAIRKFQLRQFACANGRIDPGEVSIRRLNELYYRSQGQHGVLVFDAPMKQTFPAETLRGLRSVVQDEIVKTAAAQVGKVSANNNNALGLPELSRRAGKVVYQKKGWDLLKRYLDETIIDEKLPVDEIKQAGVKAGGKSWCGIFAFWCVNQAAKKVGGTMTDIGWSTVVGGPVYKSKGRPSGANKLPTVGDKQTLHKGGVCVVDEKKKVGAKEIFLNHHVILAEEPSGDTLKTIEGNYWDPRTQTNQSIVERTRTRGEIMYYWDYWAPSTL